MTDHTGSSSPSKGLLAVLAVLVVVAGVALGMFVWPKLGAGDDSTASAGYVSAKDASANSTLASTEAEPKESEKAQKTETEEETTSEKPTFAPEPTWTTEAEEESEDRDEVASNSQRERGGNGSVCDGRAVLILHSVVDYGNAQSEINAALAQHPGTRVFQPGECSSLRASIDGHQIYAIARDYGDDIATLCRDAAVQGGNPRTLNNNADFSSPCG